jgi:anti-anti-sigma factor
VAETPFEVVLAHLDGYARVKIRGDLDYGNTRKHSEVLEEVIALRTFVVLDLSEVAFADSSGVAILARIAAEHDGPIRLEAVTRPVRQVLEVSGLADRFAFPDLESS